MFRQLTPRTPHNEDGRRSVTRGLWAVDAEYSDQEIKECLTNAIQIEMRESLNNLL